MTPEAAVAKAELENVFAFAAQTSAAKKLNPLTPAQSPMALAK